MTRSCSMILFILSLLCIYHTHHNTVSGADTTTTTSTTTSTTPSTISSSTPSPTYEVEITSSDNVPSIMTSHSTAHSDDGWDPSGYIMWCPCHGRLGNQLDQLLGMIRFAHDTNRTLILPPFILYQYGKQPERLFIPFSSWFNVSHLDAYHRVIEQQTFLDQYRETRWIHSNRIQMCYGVDGGGGQQSCQFQNGQPSTDFWKLTTGDVQFTRSVFYNWGMDETDLWQQRYPASQYPVLAFSGPISSYPVLPRDRPLQHHVRFSMSILERTRFYLRSKMRRPYLGIHLRNGPDWINACQQAEGRDTFMESNQCIQPPNVITQEICMPTQQQVIDKVKNVIRRITELRGEHKERTFDGIFIATDHDNMIPSLRSALSNTSFYSGVYHDIVIDSPSPSEEIMDLSILAASDYFIGSCVSSFTAFVKRYRDVHRRASTFFGIQHK